MNRGFYWRVAIILVVAFSAWMILWPSIPNIAPAWVQNWIKPRMNLGLDIRGGARLSYDVQIGTAISERRDRVIEGMRESFARDFSILGNNARMTDATLRELRSRVTVTRNDSDNRELTIDFTNESDASRVTSKFLEDRGLVERRRSGKLIVVALRQEEVEALERDSVSEARKRISSRIDELEVKETSITARGETIVIEVPGSDRAYFDQIRDIIRRTARLEFRILADQATVLERFRSGGSDASSVPEGVRVEIEGRVPVGRRGDGGQETATPLYLRAQGPDGLRRLREFIQSQPVRGALGDSYDLLIGEDEREARRGRGQRTDAPEIPPERKVWRTYTVEHVAHVTGDMIRDASVDFRQDTGEPHVSLAFKPEGTRAFADITTANVNKRFAIVLDERVMSAPVINEPITNGSASITLGGSNRSAQRREATDLVAVLRAGALPAPLSEGTMDFIGPTLGQDTIRNALTAATAGILLVMVFMLIWYRSAGMIANIAVVYNLMLQLAAIALLGATLTLPGFAGLALTVGMAVDSNVLINERIKEEMRSGKSLRAAIDAGYQHAFTAIFDGHVTTFISGVVLLQYGTGPIKGFAVTLLIGIAANLFTGVFATRVVFDWLVRGLRVKSLSLG